MVKDAKLKPEAVKTMLKYIYSDFKDLDGIDSTSVWDVLYAGKGNQFYSVGIFEYFILSVPPACDL